MKKWIIGIAVAAAVLGLAAWIWFVPEGTDRVNEDMPEGDIVVAKTGSFVGGDDSHHASGNVSIITNGTAFWLRFEDYDATSGPDVYFYITEQADARSKEDVEAGRKLLTPGGRDGGEATKRGNFNIPLPDFNPDNFGGITLWCDTFNVVFGTAQLD